MSKFILFSLSVTAICAFMNGQASLIAVEINQNISLPGPSQLLLDEVLNNVLANSSTETMIDRLPGGHSTNGVTSLLIIVDSKKYVLRMKANELSIEWLQSERYAMEEAAKAGIGPLIYYVSQDSRAILMDHIDKQTLTVSEANQEHNIKSIAKAIQKAHTIPRNPYLNSSEDQACENIFQLICDIQKISASVKEAIEIMRSCNEVLKNFTSCYVNNHGDLNSRNIFITPNGPIFIDWEYTNWGDPFDDLSYFSLRHNYDRNTDLLLLESYLNRSPSPDEVNRFYIIKKKTFAQLCIYFHYFSLKFNPNGANASHPVSTWADHMIAYSERREELPLDQLYFELANEALKCAREIQP